MKSIATLCAAAGLTLGTAFAQFNADTAHVNLPHAASVNGTELAPGGYTVGLLDSSSDIPVVIFTSATGVRVAAMANRVSALEPHPESGAVVLTRSGDRYRLDKVWLDGTGYEIMPGRTR